METLLIVLGCIGLLIIIAAVVLAKVINVQ